MPFLGVDIPPLCHAGVLGTMNAGVPGSCCRSPGVAGAPRGVPGMAAEAEARGVPGMAAEAEAEAVARGVPGMVADAVARGVPGTPATVRGVAGIAPFGGVLGAALLLCAGARSIGVAGTSMTSISLRALLCGAVLFESCWPLLAACDERLLLLDASSASCWSSFFTS